MKKEHQLKKEHHYVWANYLRNWSCDGKNVWYRTAKGKLICDSTRMVAKERDFYKILPLTDEGVLVIERTIQGTELCEIHTKLLNEVRYFQKVDEVFNQKGGSQALRLSIDAYKHNMLEDFHTAYENGVKDILPILANRNLDILDDDTNLLSLCCYLGHQFARTKSFKDTSLLITSSYDNIAGEVVARGMENSWWFMSHTIGVNLGFSLYRDRRIHNLCLLINNTEQTFITSDNPSINVHKSLDGSFTPPKDEEFDLFYPISPRVALMIARSGDYVGKEIELTLEQVEKLNIKTAKMSYKHIFGDSRDALKPYMKYVGYRHAQTKQLATDRRS